MELDKLHFYVYYIYYYYDSNNIVFTRDKDGIISGCTFKGKEFLNIFGESKYTKYHKDIFTPFNI
jgi:hypothetical protein